MFRRLPKLPRREPGLARTSITNQMMDAMEAMYEPLRDGNGDEFPVIPEWKIVKATSAADDGGKYIGKLMVGDVTTVEAGQLTMPEGLTEPDDFDALICNIAEDGQDTHLIECPSYHLCLLTNSYTEDGLRIVFVEVGKAASEGIPVRVMMDGGAAGSDGVFATYTYEIFPLWDEGMVFAIDASVEVISRLIPVEYDEAPDGSVAMAVLDDGVWKIVSGTIAEQVTTWAECVTPEV